MPTVEQRLDRLRRRRDFLALRIPQQTVEPHYDKSEHAALNWVIRFVEEHYVPEPPIEQKPASPGIAVPVVPSEPTKLSSLISCSRHRHEIAR
jgi:hypothetical protein